MMIKTTRQYSEFDNALEVINSMELGLDGEFYNVHKWYDIFKMFGDKDFVNVIRRHWYPSVELSMEQRFAAIHRWEWLKGLYYEYTQIRKA